MGRAPRKQVPPKSPRAPVDLAPFFKSDPTSKEGKKIHMVKTDAEKLAEDLIHDDSIDLLAYMLVEAYSEWYRLKNNLGHAEAFYGMKKDVSEWVKHMVNSGDIERIKTSFIYSALRLRYLQLDLEKLVEDLP
ncbi:hypothetical protein QM012_005732 [Aureobasidium pullulans]|uniref:Uncharacterized protein n=1 Tax=Aureobasidium pullulans TaxID=5580 RepID=A0ABR0TQL3_AURPU